ncbi:hypothetical protein, partial [Spirosoma fluminis]
LFPALLMEGSTSSAQDFIFSLFVVCHRDHKIQVLRTYSRINKRVSRQTGLCAKFTARFQLNLNNRFKNRNKGLLVYCCVQPLK